MMKRDVGINLYGCRKETGDDFEETIQKLKECGAAAIEPNMIFLPEGRAREEISKKVRSVYPNEDAYKTAVKQIWLPENADQKIEYIKKQGLKVISFQVFIADWTPEALDKTASKIVEFAKKHEIKYVITGISPESIKEIDLYISGLKAIVDIFAKNGIKLLYHNHEHEFEKQENGISMLEFLLEQIPDLGLEFDAGWAAFAKVDPVIFIEKYNDRISLLHYKDTKPDASAATREHCFTAIGEGTLDLKALSAVLKQCKNLDEYGLIIDQDNSDGDIFRDYAVGISNIKQTFDITINEDER